MILNLRSVPDRAGAILAARPVHKWLRAQPPGRVELIVNSLKEPVREINEQIEAVGDIFKLLKPLCRRLLRLLLHQSGHHPRELAVQARCCCAVRPKAGGKLVLVCGRKLVGEARGTDERVKE
eukprot:scaffold111945_cov31-Tisochrysis_lutea.AAC.1